MFKKLIAAVFSAVLLVTSSSFAAIVEEYPYGGSDVSVIIVNPIEETVASHAGYYAWKETLDLTFAVGNRSPNKQVGIRYTNNSWASYQEAWASFAATDLNGGFERWTLHMDLGYHDNTQPFFEVELAAFVAYNNGPRSWDPNNNYFVNRKVDPANPLVVVEDKAVYDYHNNSAVFSGLVRAYPYDRKADFAPGRVSVHWTTDNWQTINDTPAKVANQGDYTWAWSIELGTNGVIPHNVTYVFRYDSSAGQKWLHSYDGGNFYHLLAPQLTFGEGYYPYLSTPGNPNPTTTFNGVASVSVVYPLNSELPLGDAFYTLDGKLVTGTEVFLNSTALGDGLHTITASIQYSGTNLIANTITTTFTVKHSLKLIDEWAPIQPTNASSNSIESVQLVNGKVYTAYEWSNVAARYDSYGSKNAPEAVYALPANAPGYLYRLAVDDATGTVYLMTNWGRVYKYFANGTQDPTFGTPGQNGTLNLGSEVFGSAKFCSEGDVKVVASSLFVNDICGDRIVKLDAATGKFVGEFKAEAPWAMYTDFKLLYVIQEPYVKANTLNIYNPVDLSLVGSPTIVKEASQESLGVGQFAVANGKIFVGLWYSKVVREMDAKSGKIIGSYLAQALNDVSGSVIVLEDGTFAVLNTSGAKLERFSQTVDA